MQKHAQLGLPTATAFGSHLTQTLGLEMLKHVCPNCNKSFWQAEKHINGEVKKRFFGLFSKTNEVCPNCHAKINKTKNTKIFGALWYVVFAPIWLVVMLLGWSIIVDSTKWIIILTTITYLIVQLVYSKYEVSKNENNKET